MVLLDALKYGVIGLAAILFIVTVQLLRSEQSRDTVRAEVISVIKIVMAFAVILIVVPAGLEIGHQILDTKSLTAQVNDDNLTIAHLNNDKVTLKQQVETIEKFKSDIREQVGRLSGIEDAKGMYIIGQIPDSPAKTYLIKLINDICAAAVDLKRTIGERTDSSVCKEVELTLKQH